MKLSVAIPCLDEARTIEEAVGLARAIVDAAASGDGEVVVGDNGSSDGSRALAERAGARVAPAARRGYGFALLAAIRASRGDVIVMGDADATYDFREAAPLVAAVATGECDLAMGSRLRGRIEKGAMPFLHRHLGTPVLSWLIRRFFGLRISDCNCGLRAFSRNAFDRMRLTCGGMEFASEMLVKAALAGLRVKEFPVSLRRDTRDRTPHLHTWRDGWRHLRFLLLFAPHVVFRLPGALLVAAFGLETALLCLGPVTVAGRFFDYHHLFYSVPLFCIGQQFLWFNAFAVRFRRFAGLGGEPPRPLPLERWLLAGGFAAAAGVAVLGSVLVEWWASGRGDLFAVRRCSLGLVLLLSGSLSVVNALMSSMLELHFSHGEGE